MNSHSNREGSPVTVQSSVDSKHKLIADFKVTQNANDHGELDNMALRTRKLFNEKEFEVVADKGYYNIQDIMKCIEKGITPYIAKQLYSNGPGEKNSIPINLNTTKKRKYISVLQGEKFTITGPKN